VSSAERGYARNFGFELGLQAAARERMGREVEDAGAVSGAVVNCEIGMVRE